MSFDAKKVKDEVVAWIRDWFEENGKGCNAVVAVSGGKDSSIVAALCVEAGVQHLLHLKSKSKILRPIEIMGFFYEFICQIQGNILL